MEQNKTWTIDKITEGFKKFFEEFGRYPVAEEVDKYEYLPTSKTIQREFGGLVELRKRLGHEISNFSNGENRSKVARDINERGLKSEREFEKVLVSHFGEHFVHVEKIVGDEKNRVDFFIYAKDFSFGIDVFFARDFLTLKRIINIKEKKYKKTKEIIYLVNLNEDANVSDDMLDDYISKKVNPLPNNVFLVSKNKFINIAMSMLPLKIA